MLAIVKGLEHWRHYVYLEGAAHPVEVLTDHSNLTVFMKSSHKLTQRRHADWVQRLAAFDFNILHRPGKANPADGLSRRPDYTGRREQDEIVEPSLAGVLLSSQIFTRIWRQIISLKAGTTSSRYGTSDYHSLFISDYSSKLDYCSIPIHLPYFTG